MTLGIDAVLKLIERLRGENGCPWDRKQTPKTLAVYLVEEIFELFDAIESENPDEVCEELGDVLFHILFIASLYRDMGHFDLNNVTAVNTEKMIRRHPHVFGNDKVDSADEVRSRWHKIKMQEKNHSAKVSILDSVPRKLPALMRAYRMSERAAKTGFDWDDIAGVMQKVEEEWAELKSALTGEGQAGGRPERVLLEFGDILFTLVNVARFAQIHPETALAASIKKFEKRFKHMEKTVLKNRKDIESLSPKEMEKLWEEAKSAIG
ncbi:MAG: nucleoside triphosphate pyrophosphohydrolase [Proteobacteria bacterium]|nr:nucleoside triphosphate pyrophosphohydrolase [Pseudomonadota bacterium]